MSFQNTISGKEFCRRNCGSLSKEKFYEEYYRIIHTAYLRSNGDQCMEVIRKDFEECFGANLDNISVSYIYATTKYLVYDVIVSSLLKDGKVDSQYYYNKLAVDIGFDVWLIKSFEAEKRLTMSDFYAWQPLPKNDKTDRQINDFWHFKLPKSHNFGHLYNAVVPYKRHIFETYLKLLEANKDFDNDKKQLEDIIAFLRGELEIKEKAEAENTTPERTLVENNVVENTMVENTVVENTVVDTSVAEAPIPEQPVADEAELAEEVKSVQEEDELAEQVKDIEEEDPFVVVDLEDEEDKAVAVEKAEIPETVEIPEAKETLGEIKLPEIEDEPEPAISFKALEPGDMMPYASAPKADGPVIRLVEPEKDAEPVKEAESLKSVASFKSGEPENAPENKTSEKPENRPLFVQKIKQFEQRNPIKGFKESGFKITKKKVITAAVCLALASTVVVPMAIILGKKRK